jgi:hypothetical protein
MHKNVFGTHPEPQILTGLHRTSLRYEYIVTLFSHLSISFQDEGITSNANP